MWAQGPRSTGYCSRPQTLWASVAPGALLNSAPRQCYLPFTKEELAGILPGKSGSSTHDHPPTHGCSDRDAPRVEGSPGPAPEPASHLQVKHLLWSTASRHMGICAGRFSWAPSTGWEYAGKWLGAPYELSPWGTARGGAPEASRAHAPTWEMNRCGCRRPRGSSRHPQTT